MASVYRRPNTKFWFAGWYDAQGKFHLRSTRQADRKKALAVALEYERAERMARQGLLTETTARQVLNDILERTGATERLRMPTVREWLAEWLRDKEANAEQDTADRYRSVTNAFLLHLNSRADRPLAAITASDVQTYVTTTRKEGAGFKTTKLHLATLSTAFNKARRLGLLDTNPAEAVEVRAKEGDQIEREVFTPAEVAMLVAAAQGEWKTLILVGYYTGVRLMKGAMLRWSQVNLTGGAIEFAKPGKKGKPVKIPLHAELRAHLESLATADEAEEFVMPSLAGIDAGGKRGLSSAFRNIATKAGVDMREGKAANGRNYSKRTFHSLRHSFTSALANADVSPELRRKLTGHKSAAAHDIYTHIEHGKLADAISRLPALPRV